MIRKANFVLAVSAIACLQHAFTQLRLEPLLAR
jgi:hypothetical protein